jgi:molecular chaperone DnaK
LCSDVLKRVQDMVLEARLAVPGIDEVIAIGGQTHAPAVQAAISGGLGKRPRVDIDPQEAVALGAALYAGSLSVSK